ncbi:Crp/Fnr family transcriptional regulator [Methylobacterium oryzisoli]|uniref:Crp/Fnr family transcriptional regulator n=1 Tax=Methylobacterium oryzisoli TaxID=3385502 RepID=UPI0038915091
MTSAAASALAGLVRRLESIGPLSAVERRAVADLPVAIRTLPPRCPIVREGDRPSQCCVVLQGWLCRSNVLGSGKRQIHSLHIAGDMPDLQSLHLPVMDHNLDTLTPVLMAAIPHEALRDVIAAHPGVAAVLWRSTLIDAAMVRQWMVCLGRRAALEHVGHLLCEMYLRQQAVGLASGFQCPLPVTQSDLGDALGLSTVHVNRVLQTLRAMSLITLQNGTLRIHDWERLVALSEFDPTYLHVEAASA